MLGMMNNLLYVPSKLDEIKKAHKNVLRDPRLFIETFFKIIDKKGRLVRFEFNKVQEEYYDFLIKNHWKDYITTNGTKKKRFQGIRVNELKSRQYGGSTFIRGIIAFDTMTNTGCTSLIYCQDYDFSKQMFQLKDKVFYKNMPLDFRPETEYDTSFQYTFPGLMSNIRAEKPGASETVARKQGRSKTIFNLHVSELAEWVSAKVTMLGLLEAVSPDGNVFVESSPKMVGDYFHSLYISGKEKDSVWTSRFVPWFDIPEYAISVTLEEEKEILENLSEKEKFLIDNHNLTAGQIKWRRKKISEKLNIERDFLREYPEDDVSCFEAESDLIFNLEVRRITCNVREAISGHCHTIGVDIGGGGLYSDNSSITVIDDDTGEEIYTEFLKCSPEDLVPLAFEIWKRYPGLIAFENNGEVGNTAVSLAYQISEWEDYLFSHGTKGGWHTGSNKQSEVYKLRLELKKTYAGLPGLKISSPQIIKEMNWFQNLGNGKMGAPEGKSENGERFTDDSIMSCVIANGIRDFLWQVRDLIIERWKLIDGK